MLWIPFPILLTSSLLVAMVSPRVIVVTNTKDVPTACIDKLPTLVYWNILGLAQACRLTLVLAHVEFVDVRIDAGDDVHSPEHRQVWMKAKPNLQTVVAFPNLPYYLDHNNVKLTQSTAIMLYLGRKYNLLGQDETRTHMTLMELADIAATLAMYSYRQGPEPLKEWYEGNVDRILTQWGNFLNDADYVSTTVGVADLKLYTILHALQVTADKLHTTKSVKEYPWAAAFMSRIEQIPAINDYMESSNYMKRPLNNPSAKFNN